MKDVKSILCETEGRNKIQWTKEEVEKIDKIIENAGVTAKQYSKDPYENFIKVDNNKCYDAFLWYKNFDWFDIAKIIDFIDNAENTNQVNEQGNKNNVSYEEIQHCAECGEELIKMNGRYVCPNDKFEEPKEDKS